MTREEFKRMYNKRDTALLLIFGVPWLGFLLCFLPLNTLLDEMPLVVIISSLTIGALLTFGMIFAFRYFKKRFPAVKCPKCAKELGAHAIASGLCLCGERPFDLPPPGYMFEPLECETVAARMRKLDQKFSRWAIWSATWIVLAVVAQNVFDFLCGLDSFYNINRFIFGMPVLALIILVFSCASLGSVPCPCCKQKNTATGKFLANQTCQFCGRVILLPRKDGAAFTREDWEARRKADIMPIARLLFNCFVLFSVLF